MRLSSYLHFCTPYRDQIDAAVADALGMTLAELQAARAEGQSLRAIAEEQGVDFAVVREAKEAAKAEAIQQALADGAITQEQADRLLNHRGRGHHRGPRPAASATPNNGAIVERFAFAWPGGVWAISLENLPDRTAFVARLAEFLSLPPDGPRLESQTLARLHLRRTLIALDNAETLLEGVRVGKAAARDLAAFIRELPGPTATLLVTSREHLDWPGEIALELGGLSPAEGAELFRQCAPRRASAVDLKLAEGLSRAVAGHPLSLRLLGGAFNATTGALAEFIAGAEARLLKAEDIYKAEDHRHRTLYASLEASARYLPDDLRDLLSGLWVFHAPFPPEVAEAIFASQPPPQPSPETGEGAGSRQPLLEMGEGTISPLP